MTISERIGKLWRDYFDYDRKGERVILKSIKLYHTEGPMKKLNRLRAKIMWNHTRKVYSCSIYPGVTIGKNFHIVHCSWIEIGKTTVIGDNVRVYSKVEIVGKVSGDDYSSSVRRHARIGDNCIIGACSLIIGAVDIGDDCIIGAGAIVTKDIPPHSVVLGINNIRTKRPEEIELPDKHDFELE